MHDFLQAGWGKESGCSLQALGCGGEITEEHLKAIEEAGPVVTLDCQQLPYEAAL